MKLRNKPETELPQQEPEKEVLITVHCVLCGEPIKMTRQDLKDRKFYGEYVLQAGTMAALQAGNLCELCSSKELKDKVKRK